MSSRPSIVGFVDGTVVHGPDAATLIRWAQATHADECAQCRRGEEFCPTGQRIDDAGQPDRSWIRDYGTGLSRER